MIIIGIIIFAVSYLPIHYYYPFLGIGTATETFIFCEDGFIQQDNKCTPDSKISEGTSKDQENLKGDSVEFSHGIIKLDDVLLDVQIADDDSSRMRGLMFQEQLSFDEGMLFIFDKSDLYSIWMPNMKFYLDVIWFDSEGHVVHIEENVQPCQTALEIQTCPDISPNGDSLYILEVTSGFVDKFNITKDSKFSRVSDDALYGQ